MTEQPQTRIGTIAEEAARLIEDVATMARSRSSRSQDHSPYGSPPVQEPVSPDPPAATRQSSEPAAADAPSGTPSAGACSHCGGEPAGTPIVCSLCPLCQGIALLRSIRPETVDQLAEFASAVTQCLRDVAAHSRASAPAASTWPPSGNPSENGRATQYIPVDDESEE